ncbi:MAG: TIGR03984 family CRISPR-associated protein [Candidatus Methanoperedens sp.]|nr:TIGR03984 family CRISPR-associated protein [Candidatus Methanoperedens sp.]
MKDIGNGLQFRQIKSSISKFNIIEIQDFNSIKSLVKDYFGQKGLCVFYLDYKVLIGKYDGEDFKFYENKEFEPQFIQKMRLFNTDRELFVWKENRNGFRGRLRIDETGNKVDVVDAYQVLWGTKLEFRGEFTEISEERGTKLVLPVKHLKVDNSENRAFILTRNYISYETYDSTYEQAGYEDCRFVSITDKNRNPCGV